MAKECLLEIIDRTLTAATTVHRHLGPGLLESLYESALAYELRDVGIAVRTQAPLPLLYRSVSRYGHRGCTDSRNQISSQHRCVACFSAVDLPAPQRHTRRLYTEFQSSADEGWDQAGFTIRFYPVMPP